jgi:branched-chain amino acid transport system substrate-binding protein
VYAPEMLTSVGFPAAQGWYATNASPHTTAQAQAEQFVQHYKAKFNLAPDDYAVTAYDGALVIIDAVKRLAAAHKPITKASMEEAIATAKVPTLQGVVSFDQNGDIKDRTVSVFQIEKDSTKPLDDISAQYKYIGTAPQS